MKSPILARFEKKQSQMQRIFRPPCPRRAQRARIALQEIALRKATNGQSYARAVFRLLLATVGVEVRRRPLPHRSLLQPFHGEPGSPRGRFSWLKSAYCELNMKPYNWAIVPRRIRASSLSVLICVSAMMRVLKGGRMRSKDSSLSKISKRQCQFIPLQRPRAIQPILAPTRGKPPGAGVIETAARAAPRADRATSLSCYLTPFPTLTVISLADLDARN